MSSDRIVLDISHWQGTPDFQKIADDGTLGVIFKCTQGTSYIDPTFADNLVKALEARLYVAAYHFLKHGDIQQQMDFFVETADLPPGTRLVIDFEEEGCTLGDLEQAVNVLVADYPDYEITVYGGSLIKQEVHSYNALLANNTSLWIAQYTDADQPSWPTATWPQWSLWQWTQEGTSPGVSGNVDCNRWNGDPERLRDWFYKPAVVPPQPGPDLPVVEVTIAADRDIVLYVNGQQIGEVDELRRQVRRDGPRRGVPQDG